MQHIQGMKNRMIIILPCHISSTSDTGFPKKDARFLKIQNITNLLSGDKEGKIMKNIDF